MNASAPATSSPKRLLGLPSPPATNSDTSAGSTRNRTREVAGMSRRAEEEEVMGEGEGDSTPKASGQEWISERRSEGLDRTNSLMKRNQAVLDRLASLSRGSRTAATTPARRTSPSPPPLPGHTLSRTRSATFTSLYDSPTELPTNPRTSFARSRASLSVSSVSGSETERDIHRTPQLQVQTNGVDEDETVHGYPGHAYTAPRRRSEDVPPRSASTIGAAGSTGGSGSGSGGGTTKATRSTRIRKELPAAFRRPSEASVTSSVTSPTSPEIPASPPPLPSPPLGDSLVATTLLDDVLDQTSSPVPSPSRTFLSPRLASSSVSAPEEEVSDRVSPLTNGHSSNEVLQARPVRTASLRRPYVPSPRAVPPPLPLPSSSGNNEYASPTAARSPATRPPREQRSVLSEGLRAAGISRRTPQTVPEEPPSVARRHVASSLDLSQPRTPLTSRLAERERDRIGHSVPRASTSLAGSLAERELTRTDPAPLRTRRDDYFPTGDRARVQARQPPTVGSRSRATPYDRPASVAGWSRRTPTPAPTREHEMERDRENEPEHVKLMWDALSSFVGNLGRVEGSEDGSGESRASNEVRALVTSARRAVGAVAGMGGLVQRGVARGMGRVVEAEIDGDDGGEGAERWKDELREWREAGRETDEVVRAMTGVMLGVGRILREAGVGVDGRRSADGSTVNGGRRWGGSDGSAVGSRDGVRERDRQSLSSIPQHELPTPLTTSAVSSRYNRRARRPGSPRLSNPTPPHLQNSSVEIESPTPLTRHTSLRNPVPVRPQLPPSLQSESAADPRPISRRKVSTASTATVRGASSSSSASTHAPRALKDRILNFPNLNLSSARATTSVSVTTASASASPYAFSAASLTPHISAGPLLPRVRRSSMRDSLQGLGLFAGRANGNANGNGNVGEEEDGRRRANSLANAFDSVRSSGSTEAVADVEDVDVDAATVERRSRREARFFGGRA